MITVFGNSNSNYMAGKQVFPVDDYEAGVSQRLVDAAHADDAKSVYECIADPFADVNFAGTVRLRSKRTEIALRGELAHEVRVEYDEFNTDVTALFLAAHSGNLGLVRRLLSVGANVNRKLFRGYATTAAVREGHMQVLEVLISCGASQQACEEALLEASYLGLARHAEILMASDMIRSPVAVHALVTASSRGFVDVVYALIKCGVDPNARDRLLLQSSAPSLYASVDCYALVAAIVSRQTNVVRLLLQAGVRTDIKVSLGAWSWDTDSGDDFRVGAGLAEAYGVTWCAVEYFEASGAILRMLLQHISPNVPYFGRTLLHHAILCNNPKAVDVLLNCGADVEAPIKTTSKTELCPIHMAARFGSARILEQLIRAGCNINSATGYGENALMICARYKHEECLKILASAGADFGMVNFSGQSAGSIAESGKWTLGFQQAVVDVIRDGNIAQSSNKTVFSPLLFVTRANDIEALKKIVDREEINIDEQDENGFSAAMLAAKAGHREAFELLIKAGADLKLQNKFGETAWKLSEPYQNSEEFEKLMLKHALKSRHKSPTTRFYGLHRAALRGDFDFVSAFTSRGCDVDATDDEGNTPLMLAAKGGHARLCELLISFGANCEMKNAKHETALSLARNNGKGKEAERVILDKLARELVVSGSHLKKHTKCGKGSPHVKVVRMDGGVGVLRWGKSRKRNVICKAADVGPSDRFQWNRRRKLDGDEPGLFHVVTTRNKEVHFVCEGGIEMAEMWVRGIKIVTREAIFGKNKVS